MLNKTFLVFTLIFLTNIQMSYCQEHLTLKINLFVEATKVNGHPKVMAKMNFKNESQKPITIAKYQVGNGLAPTNVFFHVTVKNSKINYVGEVLKRAAPLAKDLVVLAPNQEIQGVFDISDSYQWLAGEADYSLRYETPNMAPKSEGELKSQDLKFHF